MVLVTGGAGFIGSSLVEQLLCAGARVRVLDNLVNGKRENLEKLTELGLLEIVEGDVRNEAGLVEVCRGVSLVFHLACLGVRHSIHSPQENHEVNALGSLRVLTAAFESKVDRFIYVSSSEVYGTAQWIPIAEDHPAFPCTVYGASKLAGEAYARAFYRTYGFSTVIVRPFNTYGPRCHHEGDSGEVIPRFMLNCLAGRSMVVFGDGTQTRDFTYVTDTARSILKSALADNVVGETINLGSRREITINELAHEVAVVTGRPDAPIVYADSRPGDVLRLCADVRKAQQLLGFEAQVTLHEGLIMLRDWYLSLGRPPEVLLQQEILRNWEPMERRKPNSS